jgi:urea transporter
MAINSASAADNEQGLGVRSTLLASLCGLGQVMFQNSSVTGLFFLAGIAVASPLLAAGAAAGAVVGTIAARFLRYDPGEIRDGLYSFNASLVGLAMLAFYEPAPLTYFLAFCGCAASTLLTRVMRQRLPVPAYTAPFVVSTWLAMFTANRLHLTAVVHAESPSTAESLPIAEAVVRGVSEVMFQANVLTGILFLVGILLCSWKGAIWALAGSLLGLLTGMEQHDPVQDLSLGIYGYNAALAAMALALYRRSILLPVIAAVVSAPITEKFPLLGLPTLTAPFVLASWIVIGLDRLDAALDRTPTGEAG